MSDEEKDNLEAENIEENVENYAGEVAPDSVDDYKGKWLRAVADYQNLKKETERDRVDLIKFANATLMLELLPVVNNFKAAAKHVPAGEETKDWVQGLFHIQKQLNDLLKNLGIEEIKTVGEDFNPEFHEAISTREAEGTPEGKVVEEVRPGYTMYSKVLEAAKVIVSK